ncbi:hypothetical protein [Rhodoflexus caldus]|uniref:hypothetical protein n=1 Tax=Rhodoflexus caldus TaxID=2891236 RepID=UPI00202A43B1|nr:hypothetical protein [Rhodoflexus caldus]
MRSRMEEIYNSSYQHLAYDSAKRAIYITWKAASQEMDEITYQKELLNYIALLKQYKPLIYMNDLREFLFTVTPDLQTWVSEKFQELYADPSMPTDTFSAIVMSQDFFAHVSIEQTIEETSVGSADAHERLRYFDNVEDAEKWLGLR